MDNLNSRIEYGKSVLKYLDDNYNTTVLSNNREWVGNDLKLNLDELFLYRINEVTFEEKAPRREAVENILGTFRGVEGYNFVYMILGNKTHVDFYFGVVADKYWSGEVTFEAYDVAEEFLKPSIIGNFRGSKVSEVSPPEKKAIIERMNNAKRFGILEGVPGVTQESEENKTSFQGVDRLIDVMLGEQFGLIVIAHPYNHKDVAQLKADLCSVYDALLPLTKYTMHNSNDTSNSSNTGNNYSKSEQHDESTRQSESTNESETKNTNSDTRHDSSNQIQAIKSENENWQHSDNCRTSTTDGESKGERTRHENSTSVDMSSDTSKSKSSGRNDSYSNSYSESTGYSLSEARTKGTATDSSKSFSKSFSNNETISQSKNVSESQSITEQVEVGNKSATFWTEYIDKVLLPRLDNGSGKGLFKTCMYLFSDNNRAGLYRAGNTAVSLFCAGKGNQNALSFHEIVEDNACRKALEKFQIPAVIFDEKLDNKVAVALSHCVDKELTFCANWLASNEVSVVAGLPQKEVIGLSLRKEVDFGLNITHSIEDEDKIKLGQLVQCGQECNVPFYLDKRNLDKHMFIAGVTGSGKTTTCQNILLDCGLPFLVIEPAKTEYRILKNKCEDLIIFTPGRQDVAPFYLNPFELIPGEAITSRADMLKATMEASFDMEAAIPQILEAAIYKAYKDKGWNIGDNTWNPLDGTEGNDPYADGVYAFPTLSDFVKATEAIVAEEGFDERLKNDYIGSIKARLQGLIVGSKGLMLNTYRSVNFEDLIEKKVVIELEEIKNGTEKSLIMGFILTNLLETIKHKHSQNPKFQHITLVEEAHRLLSNYSPGDSMNKKQGVEVFADMLAEVRKYKESLIIVDQIPNKMTPEVLKNTNTKIVHKLFAQDDKDAIGNTMALEKEQKEFLSNLIPGRAVVFTQGLNKAIQVQVDEKTKTTGAPEVSSEEISQMAARYYLGECRRGVLRGLEHKKEISLEDVKKYLKLQLSDLVLGFYRKFKSKISDVDCYDFTLTNNEFNALRQYVDRSIKMSSVELFTLYFYWNTNKKYDETLFDSYRKFIETIVRDDDNIDMLNDLWYEQICHYYDSLTLE